jgi:hypothetical protein
MAGMRVRQLVIATVAVAVLAGAAVAALRTTQKVERAAAHDASPSCTARLLTDWSDGRIDGTYPIRCYRSALRTLPADLRIYSSAPDDIAQALSRRIAAAQGARALAGR